MDAVCFVCNEVFPKTSNALICEKCADKEALLQSAVKECANAAPAVTTEEISRKVNLPLRKVAWHLREKIHNDKKDISIETKVYGENKIVVFANGKIDSLNAAKLQQVLDSAMDDGWVNIALNVGEVSFFSSAAIRVAISAYKKALSLGGIFFLTEPTKNVKNVLKMTALDKTLLK